MKIMPKPQAAGTQKSSAPAPTSKQPVATKSDPAPSKKREVAAFLKEKAAGIINPNGTPAPGVPRDTTIIQQIANTSAPVKEKKEVILAETRKKMGVSEEKRADFKARSAEVKAKRAQKETAETTTASSAPVASTASSAATTATESAATPAIGDSTLGRLKRKDMDPTRSVMSQRVERQMANTGATREEARGAVVARRDAREQQLKKIQSEQGVGRKQAVGIRKYGNKAAVAPEGGGSAVANYQLAKRVIQMAKNKGLTRGEAAGVITSRQEARKKQSQTTPPAA